MSNAAAYKDIIVKGGSSSSPFYIDPDDGCVHQIFYEDVPDEEDDE